MKKIPTLFQRNYDTDRLVRDEITPGCEWVANGEGIATRKWDGTCCLVRDGRLYKRHEVKKGKMPPANFEPAQDPDPITGDIVGWVPVGMGPDDRWHREAFDPNGSYGVLPNGTYELCGPKINGNPEVFHRHVLIKHGDIQLPDSPRSFVELRAYLTINDIEGIVWHHEDGRMAKIKARDFGIRRGKQ